MNTYVDPIVPDTGTAPAGAPAVTGRSHDRAAALLQMASLPNTTTLVAAIEPKLPPLVGD